MVGYSVDCQVGYLLLFLFVICLYLGFVLFVVVFHGELVNVIGPIKNFSISEWPD